MSDTIQFLSRLPVLTFTQAAADLYERLRKQKPRTGRMDLRIASIAIAHQTTLVTRNLVDYRDIPDLRLMDWSRE